MPAGDAGLEPGPETACRAYPVEAEEALTAWMDSKARDGIWVSPAGWWYAAWMHRQPEIDRLRVRLAAQQAVVESLRAAVSEYFDILEAQQREVLGDDAQGIIEEMEQSTTGTRRLAEARRTVYALLGRTAQAAQPEGA